MKLAEMLPKQDGQIVVVGKKGSGKSSLVRQLLMKLDNKAIIVVLDTKHEWKLPRLGEFYLGNKRVRRLLYPDVRLVRSPGIYVYASKYPHYYDPNVSKILLTAYKRKHVTIVVHELYHLCHGHMALPALGQAIAQGRSEDLRLFLESQRPSNIDLRCMTEADIFVMFHLSRKEDRLRIADLAEGPEMEKPAQGHNFWVKHIDWDTAKYITNEQDGSTWDLVQNKQKNTITKENSQAQTMP